MNTLQLIRKNKNLIKAFKHYQERYLNVVKSESGTILPLACLSDVKELEHHKRIAPNPDEEKNYSEYATSIATMAGIGDAWNKWQKSGFTDNSGYYFVFSLPEERGYILTTNIEPLKKT